MGLFDWKAALDKVRPFLERPGEIDVLTIENPGRLLRLTKEEVDHEGRES